MIANSSSTTGTNIFTGNSESSTLMVEGSSWKKGSDLPPGWFLTQWLTQEAKQRAHQVGLRRDIATEAGRDYLLSMELPAELPAGSDLSVIWRGETVASISSQQLRAGAKLNTHLSGSGEIDQLELLTSASFDLGELSGFGLWEQPNRGPQQLATDTSAKVGQVLVANTSEINDADGLGTISYQWQSRGSGKSEWVDIEDATSTNLKLEQALVGAQLRVITSYIDGNGTREVLISQATQVIAEANRAPNVSQPTLLAAGMEDGTVLISAVDLLANSTDADGDTLAIRNLQLADGRGVLRQMSDTTWEFQPLKDWSGEVALKYEVSDGLAWSATSSTLTINPVNDAPELTGEKAVLADGKEDVAYTIGIGDLLQGYSDVDGEALSIQNVKLSDPSVGSMEFLPGTIDMVPSNDQWVFTPTANWNGTLELDYSVVDGVGASAAGTQSLTLVPVNDAPVVSGVVDLGSMEEDGTFSITSEQLLAKASDVDGDELSVLNLKVAEGQGAITDNKDGTWTFTPSADWNGPVRFSYDVSDGHGNTNVAPPINAIARNGSFYVIVDGPTWQEAEANAQKLGGHLVTINDAEENAWLFETFNITGPSYPSGKDSYWAGFSDAEQEGIWKWSSGEQTTYTNWQPGEPNNWRGHGDEDHLVLGRYGKGGKWNDANTNVEAKKGIAEIKAEAAGGTPAQAELDVEPGNDAPTINPELTALLDEGLEDTAYTIRQSDLLAGASDPDGDSLSAINLKVTEGQGEIVNKNDGTWTFKPTLNFNGDVAFSYDITDGNGGTIATDQSFFLEPVNDAPVVSGDVDLGSMEEDGTFQITSEQLLAKASDVDGDTLTVNSLKLNSDSAALSNNDDSTWTITPNTNWNGKLQLSYAVSDGNGGSPDLTANLNITPVNDAPLLTGILAKLGIGKEDKPFSIRESELLTGFTDVDGDDLSVINLKVASGQGSLKAGDIGTWVFTTQDNWSGKVTLDYQVTDGELLWQNKGHNGTPGTGREQPQANSDALINATSFESGEWQLNQDGGVYVESIDGWQSPTGTIELKNNLDNNGDAADGDQFIEINQDPIDRFPDSPGIFKDLETEEGEHYTIELRYAGRPGFNSRVNSFTVLIDGDSQGEWSHDQTRNRTETHHWQTLRLNFTAKGDSTRVEILETGQDLRNGRGIRLDDIKISRDTAIENTDFESGAWESNNQGSTFVDNINGWKSLTGAIELKSTSDNQGQPLSGQQFIELNTDPIDRFPDSPGIFKTIKTIQGEEHTLKFSYAGRPGFDASVNRLEVLIDGESQGFWDDDQSDNRTTQHDWKELKVTFKAKSNSTRIELREAGDDLAFGRGIRIDDIRVQGPALSTSQTQDTDGELLLADNTARNSFVVEPLNDAPRVTGPVDLGAVDEDGSFRITAEQLLSNASDPDGDPLAITNLKLSEGNGTLTSNADGSWIFAPSDDWNGEVAFSYSITEQPISTATRPSSESRLETDPFLLLREGNQLKVIPLDPNAGLTARSFNWQTSGRTGIVTSSTFWGREQSINLGSLISQGRLFNDITYTNNDGEIKNLRLHAKDAVNERPDLTPATATSDLHIRGSSLYTIVDGPTWEQAQANDQKLGGNLVTINDAAENSWLQSQFKMAWNLQSNGTYWAGYTDQNKEGQWEWISGETSTISNWHPDEPNGNRNENHMHLGRYGDGLWNDGHSGAAYTTKGIAEIDLGSDFGVSTSANLTVNPVNDAATGEPLIEIHGDSADAISTEPEPLSATHIIGELSSLSLEDARPAEIATNGDVLKGGSFSDSMIGGDDNDLLIGSVANSTSEQVDVLTGGSGRDVFVLGNAEGNFYAGHGMNDYAQITDFDPTQDRLQLHSGSSYLTAQVDHPSLIGTGVFQDSDGNGLMSSTDELIAVLSHQNSAVELQRDNLQLV